LVVVFQGAIFTGTIACSDVYVEPGELSDVATVELWQHGRPVPLEGHRSAESARVWIDPAPFELRFEGCELSTTATFASDLTRGFVGRSDEGVCRDPAHSWATFSRCNVVATEPDTHWIWHNPSDATSYSWRVTRLALETGAEPLPDRDGWCRYSVQGLRMGERFSLEPFELIDTDGDAIVLSAWNDTDRDGWESVGELVHIHIQI